MSPDIRTAHHTDAARHPSTSQRATVRRGRGAAAPLAALSALVGLLGALVVTAPASASTASPTTVLNAAPAMPPQSYNGDVPGIVGTWGGYGNGQIPTSILCSPSWTSSYHKARCDAAAALEEMNVAYRARFGKNMSVTSTYRTYAEQVALKEAKPTLAAKPGTSNHGWGLAIDFGGGVQTFGTPQHNWMREFANRYGWFQPRWAQYYGSLPEAWHWEYAGAVASGRADQAQALGMELARTQPWNSPDQRDCLAALWRMKSGWSYTASKESGDRRGIPQASMSATFGSRWTASTEAAVYLRSPQRQIEWGLADLTRRHGTACAAWEYAAPVISATVTGATTVAAGGSSSVSVRYVKDRAAVPSATLAVQELRSGSWVDTATVTVVDGAATHRLEPGSTTTTYRLVNWDGSAASAAFTIAVAEVTATVTGPTTVPTGGSTSLSATYSKDDQPVPAATLTVQELRSGTWADTSSFDVAQGTASHTLTPGARTTTYRLRNWNGTAVSEPFTIGVADVSVSVTGPATVAAGGTTSVAVRYTKDAQPVASATMTVQELRSGTWVDTTSFDVAQGGASRTIAPGTATTTYRVRNWNSTAVSEPFTVTVATRFTDVAPDNPLASSINWADLNQVVRGYDDDTFRPLAPVTRQAMAAFLYRLAGAPKHTPPATSPFADLTPAHPFYAEITWLAAKGITTGTVRADGSTVFAPSSPVSRAAMAAFLHRYLGATATSAPATSPFADVAPRDSFYAEIAWLAGTGITTGTAAGNGTVVYKPGSAVSRQAMAAFLQRAAGTHR